MADSYTFGKSGTGHFVMRFSYHEIQYITITGLDAAPAAEVRHLRAAVLGFVSFGNRISIVWVRFGGRRCALLFKLVKC